jgi:hypothetical protein
MGRQHSFMDRQFGRGNVDPDDEGTFDEGLVGVAMPFKGARSDEVYAVIREVCLGLGLRPQRVDEYSHSGLVLRDIADLIERSEFLIFDLTHERQNVYYELGYAHGVGNMAEEVVLIAEEGTPLHYDIAALRVHFYGSPADLKTILKVVLSNLVKRSRR